MLHCCTYVRSNWVGAATARYAGLLLLRGEAVVPLSTAGRAVWWARGLRSEETLSEARGLRRTNAGSASASLAASLASTSISVTLTILLSNGI